MQRLKDWLRGAWESASWIAESFWEWLSKPPADPKDWFVIVAAAVLIVSCGPPSPPSPTPPPAECPCVIPAPGASGWSGTSVDVPFNALYIAQARDVIGDACGTDPNLTMASVAEQLNLRGVCAIGPWTETSIAALRPDGKIEEWRVVRFDNGCWEDIDLAFQKAWQNAAVKGCTPKGK